MLMERVELAGLDSRCIQIQKIIRTAGTLSKAAAKALVVGPAIIRHAEPLHALTAYNLQRDRGRVNLQVKHHVLRDG